ncbi:hypothetical protein TEA_017935 [Camellia sinensis var. sinensis]|uniref:Pentacotripeptide-repeat region of PRORP domain-containing protein n=1 Tax=Camellia sinensis var. sinensis TaxID=542762 RepID=A0A4S4D961_CAMSN|nr:hypothetical protein TEA_017935 [Camellia sinensis var. sinensis]
MTKMARSADAAVVLRNGVCDHLHKDQFQHGFANLDEYDDALTQFDHMLRMRPLPSTVQFNQLLTSIAKTKHYSTAISLFRKMNLSETEFVKLDKFTLNIVINCLCKLNQVDLGFSILGNLLKLGYEPNITTFNTLINGLCVNAKIASAVKFLDEALALLPIPLLLMSLFKEMSRKRLLPDTVTYTTLIGGLCQTRRPRDALLLLDEMQTHGQIPDPFTYSTLLDGLCNNQLLDEALALFKKLENTGLAPNIVIYSNLIQGMCKTGKLDDARKLYLSISAKGLKPDVRTYNIMINGLCKGRLIDEASELLLKMEEGCSANFYSYNTLVQGFLQNNRIQKALQLLHVMDDRAISVDPCTVTLLVNMLSNDRLDNLSKEMLRAFFWNYFIFQVAT